MRSADDSLDIAEIESQIPAQDMDLLEACLRAVSERSEFRQPDGIPTDLATMASVDRRIQLTIDPLAANIPCDRDSTEIPHLDPGDRRYEFLGELSRGELGAMLLARDQVLGRLVALKILLKKHLAIPHLAPRLRTEGQVTASLQHPNVISVYDMGTIRDRPFFAMKYVQGKTLADHFRSRTSPRDNLDHLLSVIYKLVDAIAYAHSTGMIHGHLTPRNVLIGDFGEVVVIDWSCATRSSNLRATPTEFVSSVAAFQRESQYHNPGPSAAPPPRPLNASAALAYMAPEQYLGENEPAQARTDVFSLGAILCELLIGQPPYHTGRLHKNARASDLEVSVNRLRECDADAILKSIAESCLVVPAELRPADGEAVAKLLKEYRDSMESRLREVETNRAGANIRAREWKRRQRITAGICTLVTLSLTVSGFVQSAASRERLADQTRVDSLLAAANSELSLIASESRLRSPTGLARASVLLDQATAASDSSNSLPVKRQIADVRERIRSIERTAHLLSELHDIRGEISSPIDIGDLDQRYFEIFSRFDIDSEQFTADGFPGHYLVGAAPAELAAALFDWAQLRYANDNNPDLPARKSVIALADKVDPDVWRTKLRAYLESPNPRTTLTNIMNATNYTELTRQPVAVQLAIAQGLVQISDRYDARIVLLRAWDMHPENSTINRELAALELAHSDLVEIVEADRLRFASSALAVRPDRWNAYRTLGRLLHIHKRPHDAAPLLRESIRRLKYEIKSVSHQAQSLSISGRTSAASRALRSNLKRELALRRLQCDYGLLLLTTDDDSGGLDALYEVITDIQPTHLCFLTPKGEILFGMPHMVSNSRSDYRSRRVDGYNPLYCTCRTLLNADIRLAQTIRDALRQRLTNADDCVRTRLLLARAEYLAGNFTVAESQLREVISFDPHLRLANEWLADVMLENGRLSEAAQAIRSALIAAEHNTDRRGSLEASLAILEEFGNFRMLPADQD
ncbi:MAG: protein kinase [Planctomycetota bacterium]|nr:protein kinase [Planctomycetota bacterium]